MDWKQLRKLYGTVKQSLLLHLRMNENQYLTISISFVTNKMVRSIINVERYFEVLPANFVNIWMTWRLDSRTHRQCIILQ